MLTRMALLRKSPKPDSPVSTAAMMVKEGVVATVLDPSTGNYSPLVPGRLFPANSPMVAAHGWAFVATDETEISVAAMSVSVGPRPIADPAVNQRLAEVEREIAELSAPLPSPRRGVNVDELAAKLAARQARKLALEMTLPALRREQLVAKLQAAEGIEAVEAGAYERAAEQFRAADSKFSAARQQFEQARLVAGQAEQRMSRCQGQRIEALQAIEKFDLKHNFIGDELDPAESTAGPDEQHQNGWTA